MGGEKLCHCGKPLHYPTLIAEKYGHALIAFAGDYVELTSLKTGKKYKVQRHYTLLHKFDLNELDTLGFEEVE